MAETNANQNARPQYGPDIMAQLEIARHQKNLAYRGNKRKRRGKVCTIADFRAPLLDKQMPQRGADIAEFEKEKEDFFYYGSEGSQRKAEAADYIIQTLTTTTHHMQFLACVYGMYEQITVGISLAFEEVLEMIALRPVRKNLPVGEEDEFGGRVVRSQEKLPFNQIITWIICLTLIMFKNVTKENYAQFMKNRLRAIRAKLALNETQIPDDFIPYDKAKWIRETFGASATLKRELILFIIRQTAGEGMKASAFGYLHDILSFNEMNGFVFIHETFLVTQSPAMCVPELASELSNLARAFDLITQCNHPNFFRYLCTADEEKVLLRNNFPTIMAAAQKIRTITFGQSQMKYFASAADPTINPAVNRLVKIHTNFMRKDTRVVPINDFANLTNRNTADEATINVVLNREALCWSDDEAGGEEGGFDFAG